jgi:hypothetical protein
MRFEYRLKNGWRYRVIAAPSIRPVPAFERQDAAGTWHQEPLTDVSPWLLMTLGRLLAAHDCPGVGVTADGDTVDILLGELDTNASATAAPPTPPAGWRYGVTFPVELEEREAVILDEMIREKFAPDRATSLMPDEPSRLLRKVRDALKKFADKRRSDEELVASLTNEERELIRSRRANMGRKDK